MNVWYQRQFGERAKFAIVVAMHEDDQPLGDPTLDASWGSLELWARGVCLTRSRSGPSHSDAVSWTLLPILRWLVDVGVRVVNEDPFPRFSLGTSVIDGSDWFDATLMPPLLTAAREARWFARRSEWRHHHGLRRAAEDVALPNVTFRRRDDEMEISWDNRRWGVPRDGLSFIESRGCVSVDAADFAATLGQALIDVTRALGERSGHDEHCALADRAQQVVSSAPGWRWLVHRPTAELIDREVPELAARLADWVATRARGWFIPHSPETAILRQARLERAADVNAVLGLVESAPARPLSSQLEKLRLPSLAASREPWIEGNEAAEFVRDALGLGSEPMPPLEAWLDLHGVHVLEGSHGVPGEIDLVAGRRAGAGAFAHVNPQGRSARRRETGLATALGHLLLDRGRVSIDGAWEDWPSAARARAFGVALLLPEDGVRAAVEAHGSIEVTTVRSLMAQFGTGPFATTHRLCNLGLISRETRDMLAAQAG